MKTLIFTNQKGGVGKTLSAQSVGAALTRKGHRVLLVDLDPQGNLTKASGILTDEKDATLYEVLKGTAKAVDAIRKAPGGYDLLPADIRLTGADIELASAAGRDYILREALDVIKRRYDYAILDSPPNLSVITLMGLTAANGVIITLQCNYLALDGVAQLLDTINIVKRRLNPKLKITGALLTFYEGNTNLSQNIAAQAAEGLPGKVFESKISRSIALSESPANHRDIYDYKPRSKAKKAIEEYEALTDEIIARP